jgi:hypothetical protein
VTVNNYNKINKVTITSHLNSLIIKKGHDLRKPGLALGHAQTLSDLTIETSCQSNPD